VPSGISAWTDAADPYISSISATNITTQNVNDQRRGDVLVGYFTPLDPAFDDGNGDNDIYFMVVNALTDPTLIADVRQDILINFDFTGADYTQLRRLNRLTGEPERVGLTHDGGSLYHLSLVLDGGVGDLFAFGTGGFIGITTGDGDLDGDVDVDDLGLLAAHYGETSGARWSFGDFDLDGDVDLVDLTRLATNYSSGQAQAFADFQTLVPEPHSLSFLLCAFAFRRRHVRR
jgi:hypothetical protein